MRRFHHRCAFVPTPLPPAQAPEPPAAAAAIPLAELVSRTHPAPPVPEIGGRADGTDPTRYGDWEKNGRCIDF